MALNRAAAESARLRGVSYSFFSREKMALLHSLTYVSGFVCSNFRTRSPKSTSSSCARKSSHRGKNGESFAQRDAEPVTLWEKDFCCCHSEPQRRRGTSQASVSVFPIGEVSRVRSG